MVDPVAAGVPIGVLGAVVLLLAAFAWHLWRSRARLKHRNALNEAGGDLKNLVTVTSLALEPSGPAAARATKNIADCKELAFVVTDIEGSTQLSVAGRTVYDQLLAIHDQLMREGISSYNGTQIVTEGDSFLVAFHTTAEAVAFCQDLQWKLLDTPWPRAVLRLPGCQPVHNADGDLVLRGPRVRMGVHWALPGLVACRPHALTKAPMMVGVAVSIAQEISDAAHGGQVLLSQEAWNKLRGNMSRAGFPIVRRLGLYRLQSEEDKPSWLYTLDGSLLRPIRRDMPPPRKLVQVWPPPGARMANDWGLYVTDPPVPLEGSGEALTFVSLRLRIPPGKRTRRRRYSTVSVAHRGSSTPHQVPSSLLLTLQQLFVKQAQQFEGYLFGSDALTERRGYFSFAFACPSNALRFCHTVQVCLMYHRWQDTAQEYFGQTVMGIDGRLVFKGPRVAAAIHRGSDYDIMPIASFHPTAAPSADFAGPAVSLARALADAAHGGQVLMTEEAWQGVQDLLQAFPSALYTINLGLHVVAPDFDRPRYLLEVMPTLLSGRSFKPPNTLQQLELGYREAPSVNEPMTMVFAKVAKPTAVTRAEQSGGELGDEQVLELITAYQLAVGMYAALARSLLPAYGGYECKEPEPGKFTMAFGCLTDAIAWACHVQKELVHVDWPPALLRMTGCEELRGEQGVRLWRGLRVRIGMAYGFINVKKPMNTGRADYFGELANTAARVAALAAPGQILIESSQVDVSMPDGTSLMLEEFPTYLPVRWAAADSGGGRATAIARRHESATDGGAATSGYGGVPTSPRAPRGEGRTGGKVRRASYSAAATELLGTATSRPMPLAAPFQRATRANAQPGGAVDAAAATSAGLMLMALPSKRRMSLLEVTSRSLSLGAQQLLAARRKSRTGSGGGDGGMQGSSTGGAYPSSLTAQVEHIELRALGRYLLRGLDNPKVLFQALPECLLERSFPVASEALVSMPESSVTMRAETQRRGGLLAMLRRKAGQFGGRMVGAAPRGAPSRLGAGGRRETEGDLPPGGGHMDGLDGASTDDGLVVNKGAIRHASDLAQKPGHRVVSSLLRGARHHSTILPHMHPRVVPSCRPQPGSAGGGAGSTASAQRVGLTACRSIHADSSLTPADIPLVMRRSITTPRASAAEAMGQAQGFGPAPRGLHGHVTSPLRPSVDEHRKESSQDVFVELGQMRFSQDTEPTASGPQGGLASSGAVAAAVAAAVAGHSRPFSDQGYVQDAPTSGSNTLPKLPYTDMAPGALVGESPSRDMGDLPELEPAGSHPAEALSPTPHAFSASSDGFAPSHRSGNGGGGDGPGAFASREASEPYFVRDSNPEGSSQQVTPSYDSGNTGAQQGSFGQTTPARAAAITAARGGSGRLPGTTRQRAGGHAASLFSRGLPSSSAAGPGPASGMRSSSPFRDRDRGGRTSTPSPLGVMPSGGSVAAAGESFSGRVPRRSLLGPHPGASASLGRAASNSDIRLAPPPRMLSQLAAGQLMRGPSGGGVGAGEEPSRAQSSGPAGPSITLRLEGPSRGPSEGGTSPAQTEPPTSPPSGLTSPSTLPPRYASMGGLPGPSRPAGAGPSLKKLFLGFPGTLAALTRKTLFGDKPARDTLSHGSVGGAVPDSPGSGPQLFPGSGLVSAVNSPAMPPPSGHSGAMQDLRVRAVLRAATAQATASEVGSREASQSDSMAMPGDSSSHGPPAPEQQISDISGATLPAVGVSLGLNMAPATGSSSRHRTQPAASIGVWARLRAMHKGRRNRRPSDPALVDSGDTNSPAYSGRDEGGGSTRPRFRTVAALPRATASVSYPTGMGLRGSPGNRSARSPSPGGSGRVASRGGSGAQSRAERALGMLRRARIVRGLAAAGGGSGGATSNVAAAGAASGSVYSPPGSGRSRRHVARSRSRGGSPACHSHSSSASSMYSGTASPRMTMSGGEQAAHGMTGILANVFGRGQQRRAPALPATQVLNARYRRRSAHIVLNEAARQELMQRSTAAAGLTSEHAVEGSGGGSSQNFAAAVARTYLEHRRQQQQQHLMMGGLGGGLPDSREGSGRIPTMGRVSSTGEGFGSAGPESFSHGPSAFVPASRITSSINSAHWAADRQLGAALATGSNPGSGPFPGSHLHDGTPHPSSALEALHAGRPSTGTYGRTSSGPLPSGAVLPIHAHPAAAVLLRTPGSGHSGGQGAGPLSATHGEGGIDPLYGSGEGGGSQAPAYPSGLGSREASMEAAVAAGAVRSRRSAASMYGIAGLALVDRQAQAQLLASPTQRRESQAGPSEVGPRASAGWEQYESPPPHHLTSPGQSQHTGHHYYTQQVMPLPGPGRASLPYTYAGEAGHAATTAGYGMPVGSGPAPQHATSSVGRAGLGARSAASFHSPSLSAPHGLFMQASDPPPGSGLPPPLHGRDSTDPGSHLPSPQAPPPPYGHVHARSSPGHPPFLMQQLAHARAQLLQHHQAGGGGGGGIGGQAAAMTPDRGSNASLPTSPVPPSALASTGAAVPSTPARPVGPTSGGNSSPLSSEILLRSGGLVLHGTPASVALQARGPSGHGAGDLTSGVLSAQLGPSSNPDAPASVPSPSPSHPYSDAAAPSSGPLVSAAAPMGAGATAAAIVYPSLMSPGAASSVQASSYPPQLSGSWEASPHAGLSGALPSSVAAARLTIGRTSRYGAVEGAVPPPLSVPSPNLGGVGAYPQGLGPISPASRPGSLAGATPVAAVGQRGRGPRLVEAALPSPNHPLYYNAPVSEWSEPEAVAAVTAAAEAEATAPATTSSGFRRGAFGRKSTRGLAAMQMEKVEKEKDKERDKDKERGARERGSAPAAAAAASGSHPTAAAWALSQPQRSSLQNQTAAAAAQQPSPTPAQHLHLPSPVPAAAASPYDTQHGHPHHPYAPSSLQPPNQLPYGLAPVGVPARGPESGPFAGSPQSRVASPQGPTSSIERPGPLPVALQGRTHHLLQKARTSPYLGASMSPGAGELGAGGTGHHVSPQRHIAAASPPDASRIAHVATFRGVSNSGLPGEDPLQRPLGPEPAWPPPAGALAAQREAQAAAGLRPPSTEITPAVEGQGVDAILRRAELELLAQLGKASTAEEASEIRDVLNSLRRSQHSTPATRTSRQPSLRPLEPAAPNLESPTQFNMSGPVSAAAAGLSPTSSLTSTTAAELLPTRDAPRGAPRRPPILEVPVPGAASLIRTDSRNDTSSSVPSELLSARDSGNTTQATTGSSQLTPPLSNTPRSPKLPPLPASPLQTQAPPARVAPPANLMAAATSAAAAAAALAAAAPPQQPPPLPPHGSVSGEGAENLSPFASTAALSEDILRELSVMSRASEPRLSSGGGGGTASGAGGRPSDPRTSPFTPAPGSRGSPSNSFGRASQEAAGARALASPGPTGTGSSGPDRPAPTSRATGSSGDAAGALGPGSSPGSSDNRPVWPSSPLRPIRVTTAAADAAAAAAAAGGGLEDAPRPQPSIAAMPSVDSSGISALPGMASSAGVSGPHSGSGEALTLGGGMGSASRLGGMGSITSGLSTAYLIDAAHESAFGSPLPSFEVAHSGHVRTHGSLSSAAPSLLGSAGTTTQSPMQVLAAAALSYMFGSAPGGGGGGGSGGPAASAAPLASPLSRRVSVLRPGGVAGVGGTVSPRTSHSAAGSIGAVSLRDGVVGSPRSNLGAAAGLGIGILTDPGSDVVPGLTGFESGSSQQAPRLTGHPPLPHGGGGSARSDPGSSLFGLRHSASASGQMNDSEPRGSVSGGGSASMSLSLGIRQLARAGSTNTLETQDGGRDGSGDEAPRVAGGAIAGVPMVPPLLMDSGAGSPLPDSAAGEATVAGGVSEAEVISAVAEAEVQSPSGAAAPPLAEALPLASQPTASQRQRALEAWAEQAAEQASSDAVAAQEEPAAAAAEPVSAAATHPWRLHAQAARQIQRAVEQRSGAAAGGGHASGTAAGASASAAPSSRRLRTHDSFASTSDDADVDFNERPSHGTTVSYSERTSVFSMRSLLNDRSSAYSSLVPTISGAAGPSPYGGPYGDRPSPRGLAAALTSGWRGQGPNSDNESPIPGMRAPMGPGMGPLVPPRGGARVLPASRHSFTDREPGAAAAALLSPRGAGSVGGQGGHLAFRTAEFGRSRSLQENVTRPGQGEELPPSRTARRAGGAGMMAAVVEVEGEADTPGSASQVGAMEEALLGSQQRKDGRDPPAPAPVSPPGARVTRGRSGGGPEPRWR
ncbi:hypothetical protein HYH03_002517 [Edaphochlamys debaryana]|uniref:Adenylate cyclase n=1 Tax=Edaphochlamys debaryana TaxID=47281 RepID=A0A836C5B6_9CHLO|nr:hypothetical protein HYH03_002517 [Edaphochlamys debaryana]|eukprot:KAG2499572.1 hypothetical protein HYH03_002517 [Edaphochlamys debaryana]